MCRSEGAAGSGGTGGATCAQLEVQYKQTLADAKVCDPTIKMLQCTSKVNDELSCPCPTFMNPANATAATTLQKLQTQWTKQGCNVGVICPAVLCPAVQSAQCVGPGTNGHCVDNGFGPV